MPYDLFEWIQMDARATTAELQRLGQLPELDDAQLDTLVTALGSTESYVDYEDDGYGSVTSREYEIAVSGCAEFALQKAGAKVVPRLVQRLRVTRGPVHEALLRVLSTAPAKTWAELPPQARVDARNLLELTVGSAHPLLATLELADEQVKAPAARARDLICLRLLAIDPTESERAVEPVLRALLGPSRTARQAAIEVAAYLRGSRELGPRLVDALLDPNKRELFLRSSLWSALNALQLRLDVAQRARLAARLDDRDLGFYVRELLAPYLSDADAEAELPLIERLRSSVARALATDASEGTWRTWLGRFEHATLGRALVPLLRDLLASGKASDATLQQMALVGPSLAPLATELLPYLAPSTSPSDRHVRWAVAVAEAMRSQVTLPALIALLETRHQYPALRALATFGPAAATAVPAIEQLRFIEAGVSEKVVRGTQADALAKIRRSA